MHSCLSPCGDNDMTPANIAGMAYVKGLDVIALTDHNTARNCPAALDAAKEYGICFICGMELTTVEEVHVVCLFPTLEKALDFDKLVYSRLVKVKNKTDIFGEQRIMDKNDNITGYEENLLINATEITFGEAVCLADEYGGIAFPAHIDKSANSLISNLGFIPPDSTFSTFELKNIEKLTELQNTHPYLKKCKAITDSDAHYLGDINEPVNFIHAENKSPEAVIESLRIKHNNL